jgi:hypothetical protein
MYRDRGSNLQLNRGRGLRRLESNKVKLELELSNS